MQCDGLISEGEYYDMIVDFFTSNPHISVNEADVWESKTFINLLSDLKNKKKLRDADMGDVVRNCIILILNLIDERIKNRIEFDLDELSNWERDKIQEDLIRFCS